MSEDAKFTQADLEKAVEAATKKVEDSLAKLEAKNEELIGDLRKAKADARKLSEIKPEDLTAAEERAEKAEAKAAEFEKQVKTLTTERDKAAKAFEAESAYTQRLLIDNGLTAALTEAGVKEPPLLKAAKALLGAGLTVATEGTDRVVKAGDKVLPDFVKEWAGSDEAKHFISAPDNRGGGASGGAGGGSGGKTMARTAFDGLDHAGRASFIREGGKVVDEAA